MHDLDAGRALGNSRICSLPFRLAQNALTTLITPGHPATRKQAMADFKIQYLSNGVTLKSLTLVISNQLQVLMHQIWCQHFFTRYVLAPRKYRIAITVVYGNHKHWGQAHEILDHQTLNRN
jgi:hypothetical protein